MACDWHYGPYPSDTVMMFSQVFNAVPGPRIFDPLDVRAKIIEKDDYGRIYFSFYTSSWEGVCIMQRHDDQYVYYYDNVSFLSSESYKEYTVEEIDELKVANDWNEPMDEEKMIKRERVDKETLMPTRESTNDSKRVREAARKAFDETNDEIDCYVDDDVMDYSQNGQELFMVERAEIIERENAIDDYILIDQYFMILNADGTYDPENYLLKIDDSIRISEQLAEIKERNGWVG